MKNWKYARAANDWKRIRKQILNHRLHVQQRHRDSRPPLVSVVIGSDLDVGVTKAAALPVGRCQALPAVPRWAQRSPAARQQLGSAVERASVGKANAPSFRELKAG